MFVRRCAVAVAALTALAALAGCSDDVSGSGSAPASSAPSSSSPASSATSGSAPVGSAAASSGAASSAPVDSEQSKQASTSTNRDFTKATWTVPRGFVRSYSYSEAIDLEQTYKAAYFVPKAAYNGQDVLTVIVYTLPEDVDVYTAEQQAARVDYYNKKLGATLPNGTMDSTIAGLPAFRENVVQPPDYHYSTWFAFGTQHLLQFSCQVGTTRSAAPVIANACQSMLDSIKVS